MGGSQAGLGAAVFQVGAALSGAAEAARQLGQLLDIKEEEDGEDGEGDADEEGGQEGLGGVIHGGVVNIGGDQAQNH